MSLISTLAPVLAQASTGSSAGSASAAAARHAQTVADNAAARQTRVCGDDGSWQDNLCRSIYDGTVGSTKDTANRYLADLVHWFSTSALDIVVILVVAWFINRIARRILVNVGRGVGHGRVVRSLSVVRRLTPNVLQETQEIGLRGEQRREAVLGILKSIVTGMIYATAIFMVLGKVGIDLGPLLAGAGVVGVALGFGAQTLVGDFLAGVFILVEDQYGVGDEVSFRPKSTNGQVIVGTVEALTLRNTRLRSLDGTLWHVPNGEMRAVGNTSQLWSRAVLDVPVGNTVDLDRAKSVIAKAAEGVRSSDPSVLEPPEVWGVQSMGPGFYTVRLVIKTTPSQQWKVTRKVREALMAAFEAEGMEVGVVADNVDPDARI